MDKHLTLNCSRQNKAFFVYNSFILKTNFFLSNCSDIMVLKNASCVG